MKNISRDIRMFLSLIFVLVGVIGFFYFHLFGGTNLNSLDAKITAVFVIIMAIILMPVD